MKKLNYLIIVSTATPKGEAVSKAKLIEQHIQPVHLGGLGLNRPRIDDLIALEGTLENIIPESSPNEVDLWGISQGVDGLNGSAKYLAYVGGKTEEGTTDEDTRTQEQKKALETYVLYQVLKNPHLLVLGLNQVPALKGTEMPSFDVSQWLESIGVAEQNIFKG